MKKIILATIAAMALTQASAEKRAFTIQDVYRTKGVSALAMSPDGKTLAFNVTTQDLKKHKTSTSVNLMRLDGKGDTPEFAPMLAEGKSSGAQWSADGKWIYYGATGTTIADDGKEVKLPQVFRRSVATGECEQVTNYELGVAGAVLSPDGNLLAFATEVYPDLGADGKANATRWKKKTEGAVQGHIADKLLYRHWTEYADGRYSHIIVYNIAEKTYTDVTPGEFSAPTWGNTPGFAFSPDSKEICFISNHTDHPEANTNADLFVVPVTGGEAKCITADNKAWDGSPNYSPDGRYIAYRFQVVPGHESDRFRLALYDRTTAEKKVLTEDIDNWVNDDFIWSADSKSIIFGVQELGAVPIYKVDVKSGKHSKLLADRAVSNFCLGNDGYLYYTYSTTGKPTALYRQKMNGKAAEQQLTFLNQELEDEVDIRPSEVMWVEGAEGAKIEVFVVKPHNFDPNKKYPLIVNVHGGPQMQWMNSFRADWQVYPGAGYVVAYPNPHGSTGYGQDFTTSISGDWGGKPYEDVMKVTEALAKLPYIDADRMGAMGWSYGGYFMNWLQGHDHPFKCLASMMGLYDLRSMWGATEELWFPNFDLKGQPWNSELYKKWSPSEYVQNFKTPTLILTGERDYRVSYTQSLQYFSVLQTLGIPSRLIVFSNDGHWPSTMNSMPVYYNAHLEWFHQYLGGDPAPWDTHKMMNNEVEY